MVALLYHPTLTSIILRLLNGVPLYLPTLLMWTIQLQNGLPYQLRAELIMINIHKNKIRHKPSYKQLQVDKPNIAFSCSIPNGHHNTDPRT